MTCKVYQKSAETVYTTVAQSITSATAVTPVATLGTVATDTGTSITPVTNGFQINNTGLYRFSWDVTFTPTAAGNVTFVATKDGVTLPCIQAIVTGVVAGTATVHMETVICVNTCCAIHPVIGITVTGLAGSIGHVCANAVRLA